MKWKLNLTCSVFFPKSLTLFSGSLNNPFLDVSQSFAGGFFDGDPPWRCQMGSDHTFFRTGRRVGFNPTYDHPARSTTVEMGSLCWASLEKAVQKHTSSADASNPLALCFFFISYHS